MYQYRHVLLVPGWDLNWTWYLLTETSHYSKEVCMAMFWKVFTRTYGRSWSSSVVETGRRNLLLPQGLVNITMPRRGFLANVVSAVTNYHSCGVFAPSLEFQPWPSAAYTPFPPSRLLQRVAKRTLFWVHASSFSSYPVFSMHIRSGRRWQLRLTLIDKTFFLRGYVVLLMLLLDPSID